MRSRSIFSLLEGPRNTQVLNRENSFGGERKCNREKKGKLWRDMVHVQNCDDSNNICISKARGLIALDSLHEAKRILLLLPVCLCLNQVTT
jgi:hypothetical protein